jgi:hypothetical protein
VSLTAACLGLALVGFSPFGVRDVDGIELSLRLTATGILSFDGVLAVICVLKGKYRTALFGLFLPPIGWIGAVRLARPSSIWARHRYRGERLQRATRRAADFDRRWAPLQTDWEDFVGGKPSQPNPPATDEQQAQHLLRSHHRLFRIRAFTERAVVPRLGQPIRARGVGGPLCVARRSGKRIINGPCEKGE